MTTELKVTLVNRRGRWICLNSKKPLILEDFKASWKDSKFPVVTQNVQDDWLTVVWGIGEIRQLCLGKGKMRGFLRFIQSKLIRARQKTSLFNQELKS